MYYNKGIRLFTLRNLPLLSDFVGSRRSNRQEPEGAVCESPLPLAQRVTWGKSLDPSNSLIRTVRAGHLTARLPMIMRIRCDNMCEELSVVLGTRSAFIQC